jgi:acyl-CoA reductase-like NAD-dependent aldehyde dehydrogenase
MLSIAKESLADVALTSTDQPGFRRFIRRAPQGVVLVIAPWKYVGTVLPIPFIFTYSSYKCNFTYHANPHFHSHPSSFPYLTSINSVLPALIAGNAVLLKPSPQTPLTAERFALALTRAGFPAEIIQVLHLSPGLTAHAIQHKQVDFVSFTGSVAGGQAVELAAVQAEGFKGVALEVRLFSFFPLKKKKKVKV